MADPQKAPDRLPANFDFSQAPDRLPANFDFAQPAQPAPSAPTQEEPYTFRDWATGKGGLIRTGLSQMGQGARELMTSGQRRTGAADILEGAGRTLAPAAIGASIPALVAAPAATIGGVVGGTLLGKGAEGVSSALGASPETTRLVGDVAPLALGGLAARATPVVARGIRTAFPSTEEAGKLFEPVLARVGDQPVDVSKFAQPALRAREFNANTGATYPPVLKKAMGFIGPTTEPMTFRVARDLESETGRRAAMAAVAPRGLAPIMQAQVAGLGSGLRNATEEVAERGGVGDAYRDALAKYRRAATIQGAWEQAKDIAGGSAAKTALKWVGLPAAGAAVAKLLGW